jgi:hypothetical protein
MALWNSSKRFCCSGVLAGTNGRGGVLSVVTPRCYADAQSAVAIQCALHAANSAAFPLVAKEGPHEAAQLWLMTQQQLRQERREADQEQPEC